MKFLLTLAVAASVAQLAPAFAQAPNKAVASTARSAGSDDGFAAFWTQFKVAVGKSDQNAVSQMIKYPVLYIDVRQVGEFPVIWKGAFKPAHRRCLVKQKPVKDTNEGKVNYSAFCDDIIYSFSKVDGGWKLTDFGVND